MLFGSSPDIFLHPKKCIQVPVVGLFLITPTFILKASSPSRNTLLLLLTRLLQPAQRSNQHDQRLPVISHFPFSGWNICLSVIMAFSLHLQNRAGSNPSYQKRSTKLTKEPVTLDIWYVQMNSLEHSPPFPHTSSNHNHTAVTH